MAEAGFRKVERDRERRFGSPGILLAGYAAAEAAAIRALLDRIGAAAVPLVACSAALLERTVADALAAVDPGEPAGPGQLPRVLLMSGLTGEEFHRLMDEFGETGLPRPIFAAATPTNLQFTVKQLLVELLREQRAMAEMRAAPRREE